MNPFLQTQTSLLQHILVYTYIYNNLAPTIWSLISRIGWVVPWWVLPNAMRNSQFEKLHNFLRHRFLKDQMIKMLCHYWILLIAFHLSLPRGFFFYISFFESELSLIFNTLLEEKSKLFGHWTKLSKYSTGKEIWKSKNTKPCTYYPQEMILTFLRQHKRSRISFTIVHPSSSIA